MLHAPDTHTHTHPRTNVHTHDLHKQVPRYEADSAVVRVCRVSESRESSCGDGLDNDCGAGLICVWIDRSMFESMPSTSLSEERLCTLRRHWIVAD